MPEGACIACGEAGLKTLLPYRVERAVDALFAGRSIACCPICRLQQVTPVPTPEELARYYREAYRTDQRYAPVDPDRFPFDSTWYLSRGRAISRFAEGVDDVRTILDVAAGFGHVLFGLSERYPDAKLYATEADPRCHSYLQRIRVTLLEHTGDGTPAGDPGLRFDLIVLTHALEHLCTPVGVLRALVGLLGADGGLIVEVPNCPLRHASTWETAPHLSFFEADTLRACLERAGASVQRLDTCGPLYPQRTWRSRIPAPVKAARKRLMRQGAGASGPIDAADFRTPGTVPHPEFVAYGGDRFWLRAMCRAAGAAGAPIPPP